MHLFSSWDRYYFHHPHSKFWGLEIGHSQASVRVTEMTRVGHNFNLGLSGFQVLLLRFPPKGTDAAGRHLHHLQSSKSFCEGPGDQGAPLEPRQGTGLCRPPCRAIEFPAPGVRPMLNSLDLATWEGLCPEPAGITELGKRPLSLTAGGRGRLHFNSSRTEAGLYQGPPGQ